MTISEIQSTAPLGLLASTIDGEIVTAEDPTWDIARLAWNLAVDQRPAAVAVPMSAADVAEVIRFASEHGLRVAAQGTGHHAYRLGDLGDTILVHTSALATVDVDADARSVRVGSGAIWDQISSALITHGLAGLAGSAHDVGITGYTLGGGYSWLGREHGLCASSVTAIELVTADGEFHRTDATSEPDLFWALRGGGGGFGVVTAIELEAFAVPDVHAGMMLFPLERAAEVLAVFSREAETLDERATLCARLLHLPPMPDLPEFLRGKSLAAIDGAVNAPDDEAAAILAPFAELGPFMNTFARIPAAALSQIHLDPPGPVPGMADGVNLDSLPAGAIEAMLDSAGPGVQTPLLVLDIRMLGGAFGRPDPRGGAVNKLHGRFLVSAIGIAPTPQAVIACEEAARSLLEAIEPWRAAHDYSNFRETSAAPEQFYPGDVLDCLRAVKATYDPADIIRSCHPLN